MTDIAIKVEGLSKQYRIGGPQVAYHTFRETIMKAVTSPFRKARYLLQGVHTGAAGLTETIWALKDVSVEVKKGEAVGIIGRNGAGKSTLLKILSRITEPTEGFADIHGRVGSLLEVGTGFHPELTGRENIYLDGAILGMNKAEIDRKFNEIVAFAEIEKFIDTPVKHYSSGMYVRLAFAVAAHLEPEILIVDEVLAVGDAAFQKKCLGKMEDVSKEGRTVLFVSHNMIAIQNLCGRVIWLNDGKVVQEGQPVQVVSNYLQSSFSTLSEQVWDDIDTAPGNDKVRLRRVSVRPANGSPSDPITMETPFLIEVEFWNLAPDVYLHVTLHILNEQGIVVFETGSADDPSWHGRPFPVAMFRSVCQIPSNLLNNGRYRARLLLVQNGSHVIYWHKEELGFELIDSGESRGAWYGKIQGVIRPKLSWRTEFLDG